MRLSMLDGTDDDLTAHGKGLAACLAEMDCSPEAGEECYALVVLCI